MDSQSISDNLIRRFRETEVCSPALGKERRKILIVTGDFVPVSSNCTFRALGFVEELPKFGWDPIVLTQNSQQSSWTQDVGLEAACPSHQVSGSSLLWRFLKKFSRIIPEVLLADRGRSWVPFAVIKGVELTLRYNISIIVGSYQPWSSLAAAYLISLFTGRPLVAEFRDPILKVLGDSPVNQRRLRLAARMAVHAKCIITTTAEISADIKKLSKDTLAREPLVLPHGYRKTDREAFYVPPLDQTFSITFAGTLYRHSCIETFCAAVSAFVKLKHAERIRLNVVGRQKDGALDYFISCARKHGILEHLELSPWQSQENLKHIISQSHMVWCTDTLAGSGEGVILPGRLAKMLACGRPVLALCAKEGPTWRAVRKTSAGEPFEYSDVDGIQGFISKVYEASRGAKFFSRDDISLEEYSFRSITKKFTDAFNHS